MPTVKRAEQPMLGGIGTSMRLNRKEDEKLMAQIFGEHSAPVTEREEVLEEIKTETVELFVDMTMPFEKKDSLPIATRAKSGRKPSARTPRTELSKSLNDANVNVITRPPPDQKSLPQLVTINGKAADAVDASAKEIIDEASRALFGKRRQNFDTVRSLKEVQQDSEAERIRIHETMQRMKGADGGFKLYRSVNMLATHTGSTAFDKYRYAEGRLRSVQGGGGEGGEQDQVVWPLSGKSGQEAEITWVKKLVRYMEKKPLFAVAEVAAGEVLDMPEEGTDGTPSVDIGGKGSTGVAEVTVFPPREGGSGTREEVILLEKWLLDMMEEMKMPMPDAVHALGESALWLFRASFEELRRQVGIQCKERAALLKKLWDAYFSMIEVRTATKYEEQLEFMHQTILGARKDKEESERQHANTLGVLDSTRNEHEKTLTLVEHSKHKLIRRVQEAENMKAEMEERMVVSEKKYLEEVEARVKREEDAMTTRTNLDKSRATVHQMRESMTQQSLKLLNSEEKGRSLEAALNAKVHDYEMLEQEVARLNASLEEARSSNSSAKSDLGIANRNLMALKLENQNNKQRISELETEQRQVLDKNVLLKSKMAKSDERMTALTTEMAEKDKEKVQLDLLYSRTKDSLEECEAKLGTKDGTIMEMEQKVENVQHDFKVEKMKLREELELTRGDLRAALQREKDVQNELDELRPELGALRNMIKRLGDILNIIDDEGAFADPEAMKKAWEAVGQNSRTQRMMRNCVAKYSEVAKAKVAAESAKEVLQQHVAMKQKDVERMESKVFQEKCRNEKLQRTLDATELKLADMSREGSALKAENEKLKRNLDDTKEKLTLLKQEAKTLRVKAANEDRLQKEMHQMHDDFQKTKSDLEKERSARVDFGLQIAAQKQDIEQKSELITSLTDSNSRLTSQVTQLTADLGQCEQDLHTLRNAKKTEGEHLGEELSKSREQCAQMKADLGRTTDELRSMTDSKILLDETFQKTINALSVSRYIIKGLQSTSGGGMKIELPSKVQEMLDNIVIPSECLTPTRSRRASLQGTGPPQDVTLSDIANDEPPAALFRISMAMLAGSNRRLRKELNAAMTLHAQDVENMSEEMRRLGVQVIEGLEREKEFTKSTRSECQLKYEILKGVRKTLSGYNENTNEVCRRLDIWESRFSNRVSVGVQVNDASMMTWVEYVSQLPRSMNSANLSLDRRKIIKLICQVHLKRLELFQTKVAGAAGRVTTADTIFENIKLTFRFTGLGKEVLDAEVYIFYTECLECIKRLLGVNWRALVHDWEQGPVVLPIHFVLDLICNLYNTNEPASSIIYKHKLMNFKRSTPTGDGIDLDTLLDILVTEHVAGACPVQPVLMPRRALSNAAENNASIMNTVDFSYQ